MKLTSSLELPQGLKLFGEGLVVEANYRRKVQFDDILLGDVLINDDDKNLQGRFFYVTNKILCPDSLCVRELGNVEHIGAQRFYRVIPSWNFERIAPSLTQAIAEFYQDPIVLHLLSPHKQP